jgi:hypothetical protein
VLHSFGNGGDGAIPYSAAILDRSGANDFYGTTYLGGANEWGTVYEIKD